MSNLDTRMSSLDIHMSRLDIRVSKVILESGKTETAENSRLLDIRVSVPTILVLSFQFWLLWSKSPMEKELMYILKGEILKLSQMIILNILKITLDMGRELIKVMER